MYIKVIDFFAENLLSMSHYLSFETNPRVLGHFVWKWQADKNNFSVERPQQRRFGIKNGSLINLALTFITQDSWVKSSKSRFGTTKPQHITNLHWKFEDFSPNSFLDIKVYNNSLQFKDSVFSFFPQPIQYECILRQQPLSFFNSI